MKTAELNNKVLTNEEAMNNGTKTEAGKESIIKQFMGLINYFKKAFEKRKRFTFLLVGRTGVGKSSTINSLLGEYVAPVGHFDPTTSAVQRYECDHGGVRFEVYDTPGLCDELPEENKDTEYLKRIAEKVKEVDCLWYVAPLDDRRVLSDEKRAMKILTEAFGAKIWERSIIVFTRADKVEPDEYDLFLRERGKRLRKAIKKFAKDEFCDKIPAVAVANGHELLPNGKPWLGELFTVTLERCTGDGVVPFLLAFREDVKPPKRGASEISGPTVEYLPTCPPGSENPQTATQPQVIVVQSPPAPSPEPQPRIIIDTEQKQRVRERLTEVLPRTLAAGAGLGAAAGFATGGIFGILGGAALGALGGAVFGVLSWLFDW